MGGSAGERSSTPGRPRGRGKGPATTPRARSLRGPRENRAAAEGRGATREDGAAPARGAPLLPLRHRGGAAAQRPVVREDAAARRARARRLPQRRDPARPGALGRDLRALDGEHPGLEHLAPALVGAPHSGVQLHDMPASVGRPRGPDPLPQVRRARDAGSRRAGHAGLPVAVAIRHVRLARADAGPGALLPGAHARHRSRDSMGEEPGNPKGLPDGRGEGGRVPPPLRGLDRFEAREKIVQLLKAEGLLEKTEPHQHAVRHCYRCDTVVEPRLSDQWFVKMRPLAEPALAAYRSGEIRLVPERWGATYEHWMENIRDWNISRQLWWGHRIPVFNCTTCQHQWADREDPTRCPKCGGPVTQDPDVLDTRVSPWLWPFATFGWPERARGLARFYPGHTPVTAPEILFFWVARMIMAGFHFVKRKPFATVYLHVTRRATQNRKLSK